MMNNQYLNTLCTLAEGRRVPEDFSLSGTGMRKSCQIRRMQNAECRTVRVSGPGSIAKISNLVREEYVISRGSFEIRTGCIVRGTEEIRIVRICEEANSMQVLPYFSAR